MSAAELLTLDLRGKMVVLAGCETGLGKETQSDGFVGLRYALHAAGSPSVTATLWRVSDRSTAQLFAHYYQVLAQVSDPALALAEAQRRLLARQDRWAHPYYWAGVGVSSF